MLIGVSPIAIGVSPISVGVSPMSIGDAPKPIGERQRAFGRRQTLSACLQSPWPRLEIPWPGADGVRERADGFRRGGNALRRLSDVHRRRSETHRRPAMDSAETEMRFGEPANLLPISPRDVRGTRKEVSATASSFGKAPKAMAVRRWESRRRVVAPAPARGGLEPNELRPSLCLRLPGGPEWAFRQSKAGFSGRKWEEMDKSGGRLL